MYHDSDKHTFDRVSDADEDRNPPIISIDLQDVQNDNSNTNNTDNIASQEIQARDQLTNNRQQNVTSYATWSPADNSVDRQPEIQNRNMNRPDYTDEDCINMSKQTEIHDAMTQDTHVKSISNSAYIDNIIAYDREVQKFLNQSSLD